MSVRIPNIFHFVFGLQEQREPFHLVYYLCLASCLEVNKPEALYLYYHHEPYGPYWDLIRDRIQLVHIEPVDFVQRFKYRDKFVGKFRYAHAADFVRLEKLIEHGGIYADIDTMFVNPVPDLLREHSFVLGREDDIIDQETGERRASLCNALIMSEPGGEFGRIWLDGMAEWFDGSWSRHSTLLPYELSKRHPELLHVEPTRTFYKHMWTREGIDTLFCGLDTDFEGVVSMHLWSHLWWKKDRRDFSDFHAGLLTEDFIRRVDTTYNVCARPFLPPAATRSPAHRNGARRRVLVVDASLRPFGGGQAVTAWTLQALQDAHEVTLLTWQRPDFDAINRHYGTRLQPSQLTVRTAPLGHRLARGLVRDPWNTHRKSLVLRHAKAMKDDFDIILCTDNEADFGKPGIQYLHFPGLAQHDPRHGHYESGEANGKSPSPRGWMRVSDFSFDRMRRNLTLVNSDWSGNRVRAEYDVPTRTVYPPVGGDFPSVPWTERDDGFICLGRISPEKRIERIIAILGEVRRMRPSVRLHIVGMPGDTAEAIQYDRHIRELAAPLPWIIFAGKVSRDRLRDIVAHRRWGIHAMEDEHFGIAIAEMMRAGCIVFAPRSGGQSEILGFEDRLLYPSDEDAVDSILNVMGDPLQQEELRRFLAARSEHFTAEAFMDQMRSVVRDFNPDYVKDAATA